MKIPKIVIVNGSPHVDGYTSQLVERVAGGVNAASGFAEIVRLIEYHIEPCVNTPGWPCWPDGPCHHVEDDTPLVKEKVMTADGLVVSCPVYWSSVNGLTKFFLDKLRLSGFEGKPAFAITVAGGSGNGMVLDIKAIHGFFGWGYRTLPPLPVCRFNFEQALSEAYERGGRIAKIASSGPRPFKSTAEQWRWERSLPYADWQLLDEKFYLAGLVVDNLRSDEGTVRQVLTAAQEAISQARQLMAACQYHQAAEPIDKAYTPGFSL